MAYIYDLTDTWNAGGTVFNAIKMNVTDSASAVTSKLVSLQTNGTEHFSVTKAGVGYFSGNVGIGTSSPIAGGFLTVGSGAGSSAAVQFLNAGSGGSALLSKISGSNTWLIGDTVAALGSGSGLINFIYGANPWIVYLNNAERVRIDSSGNLLVGTTSALGKVVASQSGSADVFYAGIGASGSAFTAVGTASTMTVGYFVTSSGLAGSISCSGTSTTYATSSDIRLKDNITDADDTASLIDAIQVRKFDWKVDGEHQRYGFIAQELVIVAPEAVSQPADPDAMMGVDYSKLVPMLVKEIQSLRARVAQLEGN